LKYTDIIKSIADFELQIQEEAESTTKSKDVYIKENMMKKLTVCAPIVIVVIFAFAVIAAAAGVADQRVVDSCRNISDKIGDSLNNIKLNFVTSDDYCRGQVKNEDIPDLFVQADCRKGIIAVRYSTNLIVDWQKIAGVKPTDQDVTSFVTWIAENLAASKKSEKAFLHSELVSIGVLPNNPKTPIPPMFEASKALWFVSAYTELPGNEKGHEDALRLISIYLEKYGTKSVRDRISVRQLFWNKVKDYDIPSVPAGATVTTNVGGQDTLELSDKIFVSCNRDIILSISMPAAVRGSLKAVTKKQAIVIDNQYELAFANWMSDTTSADPYQLLTALTYIAAKGDNKTLNRFAAAFAGSAR